MLKINSESRTDFPVFKVFMKILLHELFVETIAVLWNVSNFEAINFLTSAPYIDYFSYKKEPVYFKDVFYAFSDGEVYNLCSFLGRYLHKEGNQGKHYYSGIAEFWMRNMPVKFLSKMDFVNADCLLTNISIITTGDYWFAVSYVYLNDRESEVIKEIAVSLMSSKLANDYYILFDTNKDRIKESLKIMLDFSEKNEFRLGYNGAFYTIPLITNYIKIEKIETIR